MIFLKSENKVSEGPLPWSWEKYRVVRTVGLDVKPQTLMVSLKHRGREGALGES